MGARKEFRKRTEPEMLTMLRKRHGEKAGNGSAFAFVTHVRDSAGFDANRTIDAMAMGLWPSRGLIIDAFEVKCSRADWLKELRDPSKAEMFCQRADRFWLVIGDPSIVKEGELPPGWGLLVAQGSGEGARLVQKTNAGMLRAFQTEEQARSRKGAPLPPELTRSFLAALMRAATAVGSVEPEEIREARRQGEAAGSGQLKRRAEWAESELEALRAVVKDFEDGAGVSLQSWWAGRDDERSGPYKIGEAVRAIVEGDSAIERSRRQLRSQAEAHRRAAETAEEALRALDGPEEADGGG